MRRYHRQAWSLLFVSSIIFVAALSVPKADPKPVPKLDDKPVEVTLREAVLQADSRYEAATAYEAYFHDLGRERLKVLLNDEDIGIALQAAWEIHLKPAMRNVEIRGRTDEVYDPAEFGKFVAFLKKKTDAPVPNWWASAIKDVDLFPGRHHAFIGGIWHECR